MRVDHHSFSGRLLIRLGALLARALVSLTAGTCRIRVTAGGDHLGQWIASNEGWIVSFWHNRTILAAQFLRRHAIPRGVEIVALTSQSRDGELATRIGEAWGLTVLRGSTSRGGREALRAIYRAVKRGGCPVLLPDGPRGPRYRAQGGVVVLGQLAQRPVLPMGFAATRCWRLGSWDRLMVPKPFSEIVVVIGAPHLVPLELTAGEFERERLELEGILDRVTLEAERHAGVVDAWRDG